MLNHSVVSAWIVSRTEAIAFRLFDAWEYLKAVDWSEIGLKVLKGYVMAIAFVMFICLHGALLVYAVARHIWENREDIIAVAKVLGQAIGLTAEWLWDEIEPKFEQSDMAQYIREHSFEAEVVLSPFEDFKAEMEEYFENDFAGCEGAEITLEALNEFERRFQFV